MLYEQMRINAEIRFSFSFLPYCPLEKNMLIWLFVYTDVLDIICAKHTPQM